MHSVFQHLMLHAMMQHYTLMSLFHAFPILHKILPLFSSVLVKVSPLLRAIIFQGHMKSQVNELLMDLGELDRAEHEIVSSLDSSAQQRLT